MISLILGLRFVGKWDGFYTSESYDEVPITLQFAEKGLKTFGYLSQTNYSFIPRRFYLQKISQYDEYQLFLEIKGKYQYWSHVIFNYTSHNEFIFSSTSEDMKYDFNGLVTNTTMEFLLLRNADEVWSGFRFNLAPPSPPVKFDFKRHFAENSLLYITIIFGVVIHSVLFYILFRIWKKSNNEKQNANTGKAKPKKGQLPPKKGLSKKPLAAPRKK